MNKAIVFYCDILGFTDLVDLGDNADNTLILEKLKNGISESLSVLKSVVGDPKLNSLDKEFDRIKYKIFSDNLYFSIAYKEDNEYSLSNCFWLTVFLARIYQVIMGKNHFLIRGGISYGQDYCDDEIILSAALIKAYNLESKRAKHPRIVIDDDLIDMLLNKKIKDNKLVDGFDKSILYDSSGIYFLNPANVIEEHYHSLKNRDDVILSSKIYWADLLETILDNLIAQEHQNETKIFEKNLWLYRLLNWLAANDENYIQNDKSEFNYLYSDPRLKTATNTQYSQ